MYFQLINHGYVNELQGISQIFYPNERFLETISAENQNGITICSYLKQGSAEAAIFENARKAAASEFHFTGNDEKAVKNAIQRSAFEAFQKFSPVNAPWGLLIGIRPTKIVHEMWESDYDNKMAAERLEKFYLASEDKIRLCMQVAEAEKNLLSMNTNDSVSLYIGIPFCISRCLYCSFSSYTVKQYEKSIGQYLNALFKEMEAAKAYIKGKSLRTIYIGGGTPTSLSEEHFSLLLSKISELFGNSVMNRLLEYTVEAGRPDTITEGKLKAMKQAGVNRISINPQTLNEDTLNAIGRNHSVRQFYDTYELARDMAFCKINIDLIMGLPGEELFHVDHTLNGVYSLAPDNVTIHTLAVKRASRLKEQLGDIPLSKADIINEMLKMSHSYAEAKDMHPYYMYRQKNMVGNFENVGYCLKGCEGVYNVQIIEEKQTIVAVGAGAATKHVERNRNLVRRIYNVKTPEEYIARIDEMIERKEKLYEYDCEIRQ